MTPNIKEITSHAENLAKSGRPMDDIVAFLIDNNINFNGAREVAAQLISEHAPKFPAGSFESLKAMVLGYYRTRCRLVHEESEIEITPEEWAQNITVGAIRYIREKDEVSKMKIRTKVREVKIKVDGDDLSICDDNEAPIVDLDAHGQKQYVEGFYREGMFHESPGKYGIVIGNVAAIDHDLNPLEGYEHNLATTDPTPVQGYEPVDEAFTDPRTFLEPSVESDAEVVAYIASLIHVQWFAADGAQIEDYWHHENELEVV